MLPRLVPAPSAVEASQMIHTEDMQIMAMHMAVTAITQGGSSMMIM